MAQSAFTPFDSEGMMAPTPVTFSSEYHKAQYQTPTASRLPSQSVMTLSPLRSRAHTHHSQYDEPTLSLAGDRKSIRPPHLDRLSVAQSDISSPSAKTELTARIKHVLDQVEKRREYEKKMGNKYLPPLPRSPTLSERERSIFDKEGQIKRSELLQGTHFKKKHAQ